MIKHCCIQTSLMHTLILTYPTPMDDDGLLAGKFLQLRLAERDYILFATATECRYHNQILARFLSEQGMPHRWEQEANLVVIQPELAVIGGGRFRLDVNGESLHVWDESSVYGGFDASRLAVQLAAASPPWNRLALRVG